jgi:hypothetical protein
VLLTSRRSVTGEAANRSVVVLDLALLRLADPGLDQ